jgi:hypothetical protein
MCEINVVYANANNIHGMFIHSEIKYCNYVNIQIIR